LEERKRVLEALLRRPGVSTVLRYSDHVLGHGREFFRQAGAHDLEGIVSKRRDAPYTPGRSRTWLKVKCIREQEFVVGGFTDPEGQRAGLGALLVGVYDAAGTLQYAGKVGTGFSDAEVRRLRDRLDRLTTP